MSYTCSICGEDAAQICVRCTKDSCPNHICEKCRRCSDCCECEVAAVEPERAFTPAAHAVHPPAPGLEEMEAEPLQPIPESEPSSEQETGSNL